MWKFKANQKIAKIGKIEIGGQPGELPTVLIGTIFYSGQKIVSDYKKGIFDKRKARELLENDERMSIETGNPRIIDVVGETSDALISYIDFVAENTESPFLMDSGSVTARIDALKHVEDVGLLDRAIYNSIDERSKEEEFEALDECNIQNVVILDFGTKYLFPKDRLKLITGTDNLLDKTLKSGVKNVLIDTGTLDVPSTGWSSQAVWEVKDNIGYPAGCAPANSLFDWKKMKERISPTFEAAGSVVLSFPVVMGSDFLLYGPIKNATWVYHAVSVADAIVAYSAKIFGIKPKSKNHPLYKIF